jgi:dolichol-phosphate mannosyltransferase
VKSDTIIIIPTYNEKDSIIKILSGILAQKLNVDIVVVDDDSPDGTSDIVAHFIRNRSNIFLLTKTKDKGFARAYITGFSFALERGYKKVIQMDADGSHQPKYLESLLDCSDSYSYVIGSRWTLGGEVENWPLKRKIISKAGNLYSRIMLNSKVQDITGGFKVIDADLLKQMNVHTITSKGYSFQIELKYRALRKGFSGVEVPILFEDRRVGESKMSTQIVLEALLKVWRIKFIV